jgi:hypothetical protein
MLGPKELAFLKAFTSLDLSPRFMDELRKEPTAAKKRNRTAVAAASASGAGNETGSPSQTSACKRKASPDEATEPASRRPATEHPPNDGPEIQDATGEQAAQCSRQLGPAEGKLAYATMVAGAANLQQPSGTRTSSAKGSANAEPAVSMEAASRRMSPGDMSGPLRDMPVGTTSNAQVAAGSAAPIGERPNKTPIFISGAHNTRSFQAWLRTSCPGSLTAQLKNKRLMVVPSTADGFRAVVSALRSLDGKEGVSFHTYTILEDRCVRLLVKNLGKSMPESVVREELESLDLRVQGVMQLRSERRDQDPTKDRPPSPIL